MEFDLERYEDGGDYFALSNQFRGHKESKRLQDWVLLQIQEKSYESVSKDIIALTGKKLVSSNELSEQVKGFAQKATQGTINSYGGTQLVIPFGVSLNDGIYDESIAGIRFFDSDLRCGCYRRKETEKCKGVILSKTTTTCPNRCH